MGGDFPHTPVPLSVRGGARIGVFNATWPFAKLEAAPDRLSLSVIILGSFVFNPHEVRGLEPIRGILSRGIRIHHRVPRYPDKIIFWTLEDSNRLIDRISNASFYPDGLKPADSGLRKGRSGTDVQCGPCRLIYGRKWEKTPAIF